MTCSEVSVAEEAFVPNPEQALVINASPDSWLLVVAGPGTGKTQVAAMRLVHLVRAGLLPSQILVLSFSRSAVATLTRRMAALQLPDEHVIEDLRHLAVRTFDSWAFRTLRQSGAAVSDLLGRRHDENILAATTALADETNAMLAERLAGIRHVIVDEFQDLPGVRAGMVIELLWRLNSAGRRVGFTVLGDPVQSIYRWAARANGQASAADPWYQLKVRMGSGLEEVSLTRNHRSTAKLAAMADSLRRILRSEEIEVEKKLVAMQRFLERLPSSSIDTRLGPDWLTERTQGSVAILTRSNGEAVQVTKMLLGDRVDGPAIKVRLRTAGAPAVTPAWIAVLLAPFKPPTMARSTFEFVYAKAEQTLDATARAELKLPAREVAWSRLARASGEPDSSTAIDMDALRERLAWPDSFPDDQAADDAAVYVTTIHQAKGMEFDRVALLDARPRTETEPPEDPLEVAHVGFVAVTRASIELGRLPAECIYKAPHEKVMRSGRSRFLSWGKMTNFQLGLSGDIEPMSLVDSEFHGGVDHVSELQMDLAARSTMFRGRKVILERLENSEEGSRARDVRYAICVQEGNQSGRRIACTSQQVTIDLLDLLWDKGLSLPNRIFNLRIEDIVSVVGRGEIDAAMPEPWRSSRLWLGITLFGTGDFKTWKRNGK